MLARPGEAVFAAGSRVVAGGAVGSRVYSYRRMTTSCDCLVQAGSKAGRNQRAAAGVAQGQAYAGGLGMEGVWDSGDGDRDEGGQGGGESESEEEQLELDDAYRHEEEQLS